MLDCLVHTRWWLATAIEPVGGVDLGDRLHGDLIDVQFAAELDESVDVPRVEAVAGRPKAVLLPHGRSLLGWTPGVRDSSGSLIAGWRPDAIRHVVPGSGGAGQRSGGYPRQVGDDERQEELRRVLVGGPTPVTVVIADADSTWPAQYEAYAAILRSLLGERLLLLEHIGSTSVPGLAAKPVTSARIPRGRATLTSSLMRRCHPRNH